MDPPGHLPPQICIESHSNVNHSPIFYLKAYLHHTEPFWQMLDGSCVYSFLEGNNRQHIICARTISSWVRKILGICRGLCLQYPLRFYSVHGFGSWCFPGVHPADRWLSQSFYPSQTLFFLFTSPLWISTRIPCTMLSWALERWHLVGNCHKLTCIQSCSNVGPLGHSFPHCWANCSPMVCEVLSLDSWNYCSGERDLTAQHLPLSVCLIWLDWVRSVPPCGKESNITWQCLITLIYFHYIHGSAV